MKLRRLVLAATTLLALSGPLARAQDVLETTSGSTYEGKITANDGTSVEIETTAGARMKLPYGQLTPKTQYRLKVAITPTDAKSLVELADWCVATTLYDEARVNFRKALAADALMADEINAHIVKARTTAYPPGPRRVSSERAVHSSSFTIRTRGGREKNAGSSMEGAKRAAARRCARDQ